MQTQADNELWLPARLAISSVSLCRLHAVPVEIGRRGSKERGREYGLGFTQFT